MYYDEETVINGVEHCNANRNSMCSSCPYFKLENCIGELHADVIAMIKNYRRFGTWEYNPGDNIPYCSNCMMPQDMPTRYCHSCGAKMDYDYI